MRTHSVIATATLALALAGTALAGSAAAEDDVTCAGMPQQPSNTTVGNAAPTAAADTGSTVAGGVAKIRVLANDTDPNGNPLSVTGTSEPSRGGTCVEDSGIIEYTAEQSRTDYTATFTYGVSDGGFYRTATVTVAVTGNKVIRAQLRHKLGHGGPARVAFTNPNTRAVVVEGSHGANDDFVFRRRIEPGRTAVVRIRVTRLSFIVLVTPEEDFNLLEFGHLNTRNGKQGVTAVADFSSFDDFRVAAGPTALARRWLGH